MRPGSSLRARLLESSEPLFAPLALDALTARIAERAGFEAVYVSGGALGFAHAVSEALLTLDELADVTRHIAQRCELPVIVDGGVGFGDAVHMTRTIRSIEAAGAAAIEIEDQVAPKRVSHHRGVEHLIPTDEMVAKVAQAVRARRDPEFALIVRTGAMRHEGYDAAIARARAYREAGADLLLMLPNGAAEWRSAPRDVGAPLATFATLDARPKREWRELGWRLIIDPFTAQVAAVAAVREAYERFQRDGKTGHTLEELMRRYFELPELAGLEALYEIERQTTERGS